MTHPALQAYEPRLGQWLALKGLERLEAMNEAARAQSLVNHRGAPLNFVAATQAQAAVDYEWAIGGAAASQAGHIATRLEGPEGLHDCFNALAWLRWPKTKATLNAFHVAEIRASAPVADLAPQARRSRRRDRVTLFDENGALLLCPDPRPFGYLQSQDWRALFVTGRSRLQEARLLVLGHGLMHKCMSPFKSMTARVLWLPLPADARLDQVDAAAAAALRDTWPSWPLPPLPVSGWPGWAGEVQDEGFYGDEAVFRPARQASAGFTEADSVK